MHEAHDPQLRRDVAIKLIHPQGRYPHADDRLLREARAIARLNHPNVVQVFDVGAFERADDEVPSRGLYIVMQLLAGRTVQSWLEDAPGWEDVLAVFLQAARGLEAAHGAGVVHRDFKPANIFLCDDGVVKVLDFGIAKTTAENDADRLRTTLRSSLDPDESFEDVDLEQTDAGVVIGTPAYMAPEQHVGEVADPAADQFAFCGALWRALFGAHPFAGDTPQKLAKAKWEGRIVAPRGPCEVPSWLEVVLRRGLAAVPTRRWPSMRELIHALERKPRRRSLRRWVTAAALVGVVGLGLPAGAWPTDDEARMGASTPPTQFERAAPRVDACARSWRTAISPSSSSR